MTAAKKLLAAAISLLLLGILIASVDRRALLDVLANVNAIWFSAALLFFIPQILAIAHRWALIAHPIAPIGTREAGRQVLASNCLNLVLPSKLGDLAKGVFLYRHGHCALREGMHIVVFEKLLDLAALSAWMIAGWMLAPRGDWWILGVLLLGVLVIVVVLTTYFSGVGARAILGMIPSALRRGRMRRIADIIEAGPRVMRLVHADGSRRNRIIAWSFAIWLLHLVQIYCFFRALDAPVSLFQVLALMPIALFAGLLPFTVAGIGTRDWAIVVIFGGMAPRALLVAAGLLVSLRYVVPALAGLPHVPRYFLMAKVAAKSPAD